MQRESFVFYRSFYDAILDLDAEQTRMLLIAVCERALNWTDVEISDKVARMAMNLIRPQLDANTKRFMDGQKWWQFWHLWWAPKGNSNAGKTWENIPKQPQRGSKDNPSGDTKTTPNVNDNVNVNVNENENVSSTLDADASRKNVAKKNVYDDEVEALRLRLGAELNVEVIDKIVEFDKVKKWKKIRKYAEAQIKAFITTLNTRPTDKEKIDMLNTCIWNDYQWIYRNNRAQTVKPDRPSWNLFH